MAAAAHSSPFLDAESFETADPESAEAPRRVMSPFVDAFSLESHESGSDPRDAARRVLLAELYEDEMDEALYELVGEIAGTGASARYGVGALQLQFAPQVRAIESTLERIADRFGTREASAISEAEIDAVLHEVQAETELTPAFENFLDGLKKMVKRVVSGAVSLAKKGIQAAVALGLGPLLKRFAGYIKPVFGKVLKIVLDRLPIAVQPAARQLLQKLGVAGEVADHESAPAIDVSPIQHELNNRIADLLLSDPEVEPEREMGFESYETMGPGIAELDRAREQFIGELEGLKDGEDPTPALERFVPAMFPIAKAAIAIAGRKNVVHGLASVVGSLIGRFVGPSATQSLSTALVDAGLKLIHLEVSETDQRAAAHSAIAATVEDTVRRVSELPETAFENQALLEGSVLQEFERAAAGNFPPLLSNVVYRQRPDLVETDQRRGAWVACPLRGNKRYKKFSRVVKARITPRMAMAIPIFGGVPLAAFFQEQLGLEPGEELEADVHMYEAMPGTLLPEVARMEGFGDGTGQTEAEFHPLTSEAAALLVGEPGLGQEMPPNAMAAARALGVGQRFYRLGVPGRRVVAIAAPNGRRRHRHRTHLHTTLDFPGDRVRLHLFLSERRAQELAATLRKPGQAGAAAARLRAIIDRGLDHSLIRRMAGHLKVVHEALAPQQSRGSGLKRVPPGMIQTFAAKIGEWALGALATFLATPQQLIAAADNGRDGVTIVVTIANPPGMAAIRQSLAGGAPTAAAPVASSAAPAVQVEVFPGHHRG
ncbi:MAG: hypothetical protein ABI647_10335 [Gemmatimonadota bacterium]